MFVLLLGSVCWTGTCWAEGQQGRSPWRNFPIGKQMRSARFPLERSLGTKSLLGMDGGGEFPG